MHIVNGLWEGLLDLLTYPPTQSIAAAFIAMMSAMSALYVLPEFVAESALLPRGTRAAGVLRVLVVLAGVAGFAAIGAGLIIALPRP